MNKQIKSYPVGAAEAAGLFPGNPGAGRGGQGCVMNPKDYDAVEVHRCVECLDAGLNRYVEQADEGQEMPDETAGAPFWSVYLHYDPVQGKGTGVECVADCAVEEHAQLVAEALQRWIAAAV